MSGGLHQAQIDMTQFNIHFVILFLVLFFFFYVQIFKAWRRKKPTETHMNQ